ncbi:glycosyltransferase [Ginsengibacter hankyongi]|uniref:Glycosyltransferase n=1 Tax=Ginsengibacter hankyongi TaxID=2607284 RepID=A0A5J5IC63_9BACT|nr:glycosyltransferase [Ginsengibacter hankyongi]KAA9036402.1 glycosyltransferase [Ginsengibacter hankyongi]
MVKTILYIGSLNESGNSFGRYKTLKAMGNEVTGIDTDAYVYGGLFDKFHHHLNVGPGILALNKKVLQTIEEVTPEIIWVDNKPFLQSRALKKIRSKWPGIKIINLVTDDPTGKYKNAWRLCLRTAKYYDFHFVQRAVNIPELKKYGAKRVEICYRSYDPSLHRVVSLNAADLKKYKTPVGFIGTHESYREEYIVHLIKNKIPVSITGNDWQHAKQWDVIKPHYKGPSVYGNAYIKTINGFDIALHFLRHTNRDEQDSRTFEIPACGTFMLAEKSGVHLSLFEDGKEAVFFETKEQLLEKIKYYLEHPDERKTIAKAGHERCTSSGYSHAARLQEVIGKIFT